MTKRCVFKTFFSILLFISVKAASQDESLTHCNRISTDSLREFVYILASDSMEGRETGWPGQKKAAHFLASKYFSWELKPAGNPDSLLRVGGDIATNKRAFNENEYYQNHSISIRNNKGRNISVSGESFLYGKDFYYPDNYMDTNTTFNDLIFIGLNKNDLFANIYSSKKHSGKNLVLFENTTDTTSSSLNKFTLNVLPSVAPAAIFIITSEKNINKYFSLNDQLVPGQPFIQILISEKIAKKLFGPDGLRRISEKIEKKAKTQIKKIKISISVELVKNTNRLKGQNILAFIPGSDINNETIVVSSHYDHLGIRDTLIYYGADDNASGTAVVMELARIFSQAKKAGQGPRRNLLFLNVSGEEKGLLGSAWYVGNPSFPIENTIANLNIDMIGRIDPAHDSAGVKNYIYIIGSDKMSTELHTINEDQNKKGPGLELNYKYNTKDDPNRYYSRSDHYNFVKKGIPAIFYFNGMHADYHKPTDTPDKIDIELLANRARLIFLTTWELANRNDRIVVDKKE